MLDYRLMSSINDMLFLRWQNHSFNKKKEKRKLLIHVTFQIIDQ